MVKRLLTLPFAERPLKGDPIQAFAYLEERSLRETHYRDDHPEEMAQVEEIALLDDIEAESIPERRRIESAIRTVFGEDAAFLERTNSCGDEFFVVVIEDPLSDLNWEKMLKVHMLAGECRRHIIAESPALQDDR